MMNTNEPPIRANLKIWGLTFVFFTIRLISNANTSIVIKQAINHNSSPVITLSIECPITAPPPLCK